jgi:hypothetical protein
LSLDIAAGYVLRFSGFGISLVAAAWAGVLLKTGLNAPSPSLLIYQAFP